MAQLNQCKRKGGRKCIAQCEESCELFAPVRERIRIFPTLPFKVVHDRRLYKPFYSILVFSVEKDSEGDDRVETMEGDVLLQAEER